MHFRPVYVLCAPALIAMAAGATEPGNLMEITSTTSMSMGSTHMPPTTRTDKVCTSARKPDFREVMSRRKECRITDFKKAGNTISYHLTCSGDTQMSGDGKFTLLAGGGIHGSMHMTGAAGGQHMSMATTEDGVRIGSCDYTPPAAQ